MKPARQLTWWGSQIPLFARGAMVAWLLLLPGCSKQKALTGEQLQQAMAHRNLGLAYLEEDRYPEAIQEFQALLALVPWEPMVYANLGLAYLRQDDYQQARKWLEKAAGMAPDSPDIQLLLAQLYQITGREKEAVRILTRLVEKHPNHPNLLFLLGQYYLHRRDSTSMKKAEIYLSRLVTVMPANLKARLLLLEAQMASRKRADALQNLETLRQILPSLSPPVQEALDRAIQALLGGDWAAARPQVQILHNLLKNLPQYQAGEAELRGSARTAVGRPVYHFIKLTTTATRKADTRAQLPASVHFQEVTTSVGLKVETPSERKAEVKAFACADFDGDGDLDLLGCPSDRPPQIWENQGGRFGPPRAVDKQLPWLDTHLAKFADFDNDGYLDLLITGRKFIRLLKNDGQGNFSDWAKGSQVNVPSNAIVIDALFVDLDHEGDLDLLLATSNGVFYFQNDGRGVFADRTEEAGFSAATGAASAAGFADLDEDRDMDVVVGLDDQPLHHFENLRQGFFREVARQSGLADAVGVTRLAIADYNNDGYLDLTAVTGHPTRLTAFQNRGDGTFGVDSSAFQDCETALPQIIKALRFFDLDNDGFLDLLVGGEPSRTDSTQQALVILYNEQGRGFLPAAKRLPTIQAPIWNVCTVDYDADGDLDIAIAAGDGLHLLRNNGGNLNNYLEVRLTGLRSGSGKNNYFGIGARVEVKAGALTQVRVMTEPIAHFGLDGYQRADVLRVVWTNGVPQNRFHPEKNQTLVENQILKGSCPWLFAWDGKRFRFVTDVLWASALGMPLGILGTEMHYAFPEAAVEYMHLPGHLLTPDPGGTYQLRFTTELWETPYLDQVELLAVDHPDSVAVFVDESFQLPPFPPLRVFTVTNPLPLKAAWDEQGRSWTQALQAADGRYVDNLVPDAFQGVTHQHDLILDPGDLAGADSVFLFLTGWLFPTDASINVHLAQGAQPRVIHPYLQVRDERGNWVTVLPHIGFPKGKNKTVVVNLTGKFLSRRYQVRLRTNMQIYWDRAFFATRASGLPLRIQRLAVQKADLHYRGFSTITRIAPHGPDVPLYNPVDTLRRWHDLKGYYTRYGDVTPLLKQPDNRYVIMNAGDEISLQFDGKRLAPLPDGWQRDFLFYNVGWLKDGDLNTASGQTVAPLPFHGMHRYPYGPDEHYPETEALQHYRRRYNIRWVDPAKRVASGAPEVVSRLKRPHRGR